MPFATKFRSWIASLVLIVQRVRAGAVIVPNINRQTLPKFLEILHRRDRLTIAVLLILIMFSATWLTAGRFADGSEPDYGGEYREGLVGQPRFINPVLSAASSIDSDLSRIVYAQLLRFDPNLNLAPDLAEDLPAVSADQKTYTLKLKTGLLWQDGRAITADDVVFTIQTIQNAEYESPLRGNFARVKVEKIDDQTVTFVLREVMASFITNLAIGILPKHIWQELAPTNFRLADVNLKPIGSGPFIVRAIKKTPDGTVTAITLQANDRYYAGRPWLDRITFDFYPDHEELLYAYQAKAIQGLGYLPFDKKLFLEASDSHRRYPLGLPQYSAVFFNLPKSPILADKAVRQALWLSTDRQAIIEEAYSGLAQPAYGPIVEGNLGYLPRLADLTHRSLAEAAEILDRAGWVLDPQTQLRSKNLQPLEFNLVTNNFVLNVKTAQLLQSQWQQIGAAVHLIIVSGNELEQNYIRSRNFDALLFAEITGPDPDPFPFWHSSQTRDPGLNLSGFSNPEVDKLLTEARQTNDVNVRAKHYQRFQLIILDALPAIFLDSAVFVYNLPNKIQGFEQETIIHPSERFSHIERWYIETR